MLQANLYRHEFGCKIISWSNKVEIHVEVNQIFVSSFESFYQKYTLPLLFFPRLKTKTANGYRKSIGNLKLSIVTINHNNKKSAIWCTSQPQKETISC